MKDTVRVSAMAKIMGHNTAAVIQNPEKSGDAPYTEADFGDDAQHRYSAVHGTQLMIVESLRGQGATVAMAGEFIRSHVMAFKMFFDELEADQPVTPRFVLGMQTMIEDSLTGPHWRPVVLVGTGTGEEVMATITAEVQKVGLTIKTRKGTTEERSVGGPWIAMQSIPEAYRLFKQRARAQGYSVDGRAIYKVSIEAED